MVHKVLKTRNFANPEPEKLARNIKKETDLASNRHDSNDAYQRCRWKFREPDKWAKLPRTFVFIARDQHRETFLRRYRFARACLKSSFRHAKVK